LYTLVENFFAIDSAFIGIHLKFEGENTFLGVLSSVRRWFLLPKGEMPLVFVLLRTEEKN
jgi:hypothetical protein